MVAQVVIVMQMVVVVAVVVVVMVVMAVEMMTVLIVSFDLKVVEYLFDWRLLLVAILVREYELLRALFAFLKRITKFQGFNI